LVKLDWCTRELRQPEGFSQEVFANEANLSLVQAVLEVTNYAQIRRVVNI